MKSLSLKKAIKMANKFQAYNVRSIKNIPWKSLGGKAAATVSSPWFIAGSALSAASVGGYFAYRFFKVSRNKQRLSETFGSSAKSQEKCQKVMSKSPRVCLPSDTVSQAAKLMKEQDVGFIPIINDPQNRQLVGIVTDRDLVMQLAADDFDPKNTKLESMMSRDVVICHDTDRLENALTAMSEHQVKRIPVLDKKDRLVGVISQADVAATVKPVVTGEVVKDITH